MNKDLEKLIQDAVDRGIFKNKNNGMEIPERLPFDTFLSFALLFFWVYLIISFL